MILKAAGIPSLETPMNKVASLSLITLGLLLISAPAFAGITIVPVPEPMSLSLLAGGVLAIAAVKRMRRK